MTEALRLLLPPKAHQVKGVEFALAKRFSLNGDEMGVGKTLQALALVANSAAAQALVVCPALVVFNWKAEIQKFLGEEALSRFKVVSYDSLKYVESLKGYDVLICDECHMAKNMQAQRTKILHALVEKYPPKYFIGLSGTPIKNSVPEFYSLLKLVWYGGNFPEFDVYSKSIYGFLNTFTTKKSLFIGGRQITKYDGVRNVEKLKALVRCVYIRRRTREVLDLPDKTYQEVLLDDRAVFDSKIKDAWESYLGGKNRNLFASNKAVSALAKVGSTVEFVRGLLQETSRVIVYSDHIQPVKEIHASFQVGESRYITSETTPTIRAEIFKEFEAGRCKVLVGTIGAMSVGVNLTSCHHMVFNDFPWVPADMAQAEGRIHRFGQRERCFYYYMLASRQDQIIYRTLAAKKKLIEQVGV